MNRREYVTATAATMSSITVTAVAGCTESLPVIGGTPEKEEKVKEITPSNSYFTKIVLYESGAAEITLQEDHGDYARIGITHEIKDLDWEPDGKPDDAYAIWDAPDFQGPVTVDMKSAIQSEGPYPSPKFRMKLLPPGEQNIIHTGPTSIDVVFEVPDSYLPE